MTVLDCSTVSCQDHTCVYNTARFAEWRTGHHYVWTTTYLIRDLSVLNLRWCSCSGVKSAACHVAFKEFRIRESGNRHVSIWLFVPNSESQLGEFAVGSCTLLTVQTCHSMFKSLALQLVRELCYIPDLFCNTLGMRIEPETCAAHSFWNRLISIIHHICPVTFQGSQGRFRSLKSAMFDCRFAKQSLDAQLEFPCNNPASQSLLDLTSANWVPRFWDDIGDYSRPVLTCPVVLTFHWRFSVSRGWQAKQQS